MFHGFYTVFSVENVGVFSWNIKQKCISGKSQPSFYFAFCCTNYLIWGIEMFWDTKVRAWPQFKAAKVAATHRGTWGWDMTVKAVLLHKCCRSQSLALVLYGQSRQWESRSCWLQDLPLVTCSDTRKHISLQLCCFTLSVSTNRFQATSTTVLACAGPREGSSCCPGCWWPGRGHGAAGCHSARGSREGHNSITSRGGRSRKSSCNARGRKPVGNRSWWEGGHSWRSSSDCGGSIRKPSSRKSCWSICQGSRKNCSIRSSQGVAVSNSWGRHSCSPRCLMGWRGWQYSLPWAGLTDPDGHGRHQS